MNIIFLDVDGVLNSNLKPGYFDHDCLSNLGSILTRTKANIVISSSWRTIPDMYQSLLSVLHENGVDPERILGCTPNLNGAGSRAEEIVRWLDANAGPALSVMERMRLWEKNKELPERKAGSSYSVRRFVAIDDMPLTQTASRYGELLCGSFFNTNPNTGLTAADAQEIVDWMNGSPPAVVWNGLEWFSHVKTCLALGPTPIAEAILDTNAMNTHFATSHGKLFEPDPSRNRLDMATLDSKFFAPS